MVGLQNFIPAWNAHTIPSKGIPDALFAAHLRTARILPHFLPPAEELAPFERDPLDGQPDLQVQRETFTFMHLADAFIQSDLQCICSTPGKKCKELTKGCWCDGFTCLHLLRMKSMRAYAHYNNSIHYMVNTCMTFA